MREISIFKRVYEFREVLDYFSLKKIFWVIILNLGRVLFCTFDNEFTYFGSIIKNLIWDKFKQFTNYIIEFISPIYNALNIASLIISFMLELNWDEYCLPMLFIQLYICLSFPYMLIHLIYWRHSTCIFYWVDTCGQGHKKVVRWSHLHLILLWWAFLISGGFHIYLSITVFWGFIDNSSVRVFTYFLVNILRLGFNFLCLFYAFPHLF